MGLGVLQQIAVQLVAAFFKTGDVNLAAIAGAFQG